MKKKYIITIVMAFIMLFGCTENERVINDCSQCNFTNNCSMCAADCSKCGSNISITPVVIKAGLTMIMPPACTDEFCKISTIKGWASDLSLQVQLYNASWAQGPIMLMYTENEVAVLKLTSRMEFMKSVCDFVNSTRACTLYEQELNESKKSISACLAKNGISMDTIAFYHTNTCPHCAKMKPWVQELERKGYKFFWAEATNSTVMAIARECYSTILKFDSGVPQFACPSNGGWQLGEFMSKESMEKFASDCVAAAK